MKITPINSSYSTKQRTLIDISKSMPKEHTDVCSTGNIENPVTYSKQTMQTKSMGTRVCNYLEEIGYFDGLSSEDKESFKNEILSNVYSYQKGDISTAYVSMLDSFYYLRSIASTITNPQHKEDFYSFIDYYRQETISAIHAYCDELEQQKIDEKQQKSIMQLKKMENEIQNLKEMAENSDKQVEGMKEAFEKLSKCMTIAMRILRGDYVPISDEKYLMENEPDLYKMAVTFRQEKEDAKEYESVLEDEDNEENCAEVGSDNPHLEEIVSDAVETE